MGQFAHPPCFTCNPAGADADPYSAVLLLEPRLNIFGIGVGQTMTAFRGFFFKKSHSETICADHSITENGLKVCD